MRSDRDWLEVAMKPEVMRSGDDPSVRVAMLCVNVIGRQT